MESSIVTAVFLPTALGIIMLGMGLSLSVLDFRRIFVSPRLVAVGLVMQLLGLPLLAWLIAEASGLSPELAVGLMLVAACPVGTIANLMVHVSRGDGALTIILTALSSFISVLSIPLIINAASRYFMGRETDVQLPFLQTVLQIFLMVIFPVGVGMLIKRRVPSLAQRLVKPLKLVSLFFLLVIVAGAIIKERSNIPVFLVRAGTATLALNCAAMLMGYLVARLFINDRSIGRALLISTGMRNGTLAIAIASAPSMLNNPTMAIPAAIYSLSMFLTIALVVGWFAISGTLATPLTTD